MGRKSTQHRAHPNARTALVIGALLLASAPAFASESLVDRVVAVVNGRPILYSQVMQKVNPGPLVVVSDYPATERTSPFERALQDSINQELIMQKAEELDISVRDDDVMIEIRRLIESRGLSLEELHEALSQEGTTFERYKTDFRDKMIMQQFLGKVISPLISKTTDRDIEMYFLRKTGGTSELVQLELRQILIAAPATASPDVMEAKETFAREVHQKLTDGLPFAEAVKIYTDDTAGRANGGSMPPLRLNDLASSIRSAVETLDPGQFTAPVKTAQGFHLFLLENKKFAGSDEFKRMKPQLEMELRNAELAGQTQRWLMEQRQKNKVETIMK